MIKSIKKETSKKTFECRDRHQELLYESQQWWQTDHLLTKAHYLFMQQWMMGAKN